MINTVAGKDTAIPKTKTFMDFLTKRYEEMRQKLIDVLQKQKYVCVTTDVWSSRAQSFLGMTVHFINDDFEHESYVLAFRELKKKQTFDVLASEILKVFEDYNIPVEKITNIVTDGGSSFCKAFKVYGRGADPLVEKQNTGSASNEESENDEVGIPFMQYIDGEHFYSNTSLFESNNAVDSEDYQSESSNDETMEEDETLDNYFSTENARFDDDLVHIENERNKPKLPPHRRCLSHALNLIAGDFEKQLSVRANKALIMTMNKLQTVWVLPRKSSQAKTIAKEILGCQLSIPCETRWNSKYDAVSHIYRLREKINDYIDVLKNTLKSKKVVLLEPLDEADWVVIKAYLKVMEPVAISLDKLQGQRNCGQGYILPTLFSMRHRIFNLCGINIMADFIEAMKRSINDRFKNIFQINDANRDLVVAALCIPRFKANFIADESLYILVRNMLLIECVKLSTSECSNEDETNGDNLEEEIDDFYLSFSSRRSLRRVSVEQNIEIEISRFLEDDRKENSILNEYPNIKKAYYKFNTTLSSSGAVERLFSQSKLIFTPQRSCILAANFERVLLLKHNKNLMS